MNLFISPGKNWLCFMKQCGGSFGGEKKFQGSFWKEGEEGECLRKWENLLS